MTEEKKEKTSTDVGLEMVAKLGIITQAEWQQKIKKRLKT
jgi:hypothetical protein